MAFGEVGTSLSKIKANSLNLAGTFGFSGTVSGLADETPLVSISTFTSDGSDATASFTSGIDSTYKEYLFVLNNIHPETNGETLTFQTTTDGSNFNVTATTTFFQSRHKENGSTQGLEYEGGSDLAQGTGFQALSPTVLGDADSAVSGVLKLFNPSSTTFVKHFLSRTSSPQSGGSAHDSFIAGYFNTTSAVTGVQFKYSSGEIQGGTIDLFGVV